MNKPFKVAPAAGSVPPLVEPAANNIGAASTRFCESGETVPNPTGEAGAPNLSTFSYRTTICSSHDTATATSCSECDRGEVDAACADCSRVAPLNDDGECEYCADAGELPVVEFHMKWLCHGILRNPNGRVEL